MLKIALASIAAFVIIASLLLFYQAGVFDRVKFFEDQKGPYFLVYKEYTGTYSAVGARIKNVHKYLTDLNKVSVVKGGFTVFYDNPVNRSTDSLRSISGVITDSLIEVEPPYKSDVFGKSYCIVGKYPLRSFFSFATGIYKIYGALEKYTKSKNTSITGPVMEVIDTEKKVILYIVPVNATANLPIYGK
jgi:hypothetical protein